VPQAAHGWVAKFEGQGGFTKRYMVQRGSILLYYETYGAPEPRGVFLLDTASVQKGAMLAPRSGVLSYVHRSRIATRFCLVLSKPSGLRWELCLPNEGTLDRWIDAMMATGVVTRLPDLPLQPEAPLPPSPGGVNPALAGYAAAGRGGPAPKPRPGAGPPGAAGPGPGHAPPPADFATLTDAYAAGPGGASRAAGPGAYGRGPGGYPAVGAPHASYAAAASAQTPAPPAPASTPQTADTIGATPSHETASEFRAIPAAEQEE